MAKKSLPSALFPWQHWVQKGSVTVSLAAQPGTFDKGSKVLGILCTAAAEVRHQKLREKHSLANSYIQIYINLLYVNLI